MPPSCLQDYEYNEGGEQEEDSEEEEGAEAYGDAQSRGAWPAALHPLHHSGGPACILLPDSWATEEPA